MKRCSTFVLFLEGVVWGAGGASAQDHFSLRLTVLFPYIADERPKHWRA